MKLPEKLQSFYDETGYSCIDEGDRVMIPFITHNAASYCKDDIEHEYPYFVLSIEPDPYGYNIIVK